jgi:hypothetical protein
MLPNMFSIIYVVDGLSLMASGRVENVDQDLIKLVFNTFDVP